jgi:hypothetical protein
MFAMALLSLAGDEAAGRLGHNMMSMPSYASNGAAEA